MGRILRVSSITRQPLHCERDRMNLGGGGGSGLLLW